MHNSTSLLLDEYPVLFSAKLAAEIGLNEAILLQQINYWIKRTNNVRDGYKWVYNSVSQWAKQLPFFSESTIKRTIKSLKDKELIITGSYNVKNFDKTSWYRINYEALNELAEKMEEDPEEDYPENDESVDYRLVQNDPMDSVKMVPSDSVNLTRPIPKTTTKTTTKNSMDSSELTKVISEPEAPLADVEPILTNKGEEWRPTQEEYEAFCRYHPNVDVKAEIVKMASWAFGNPKKRKTSSGMRKFVTTWLDREQDRNRGSSAPRSGTQVSKTERTRSEMNRIFEEMRSGT